MTVAPAAVIRVSLGTSTWRCPEKTRPRHGPRSHRRRTEYARKTPPPPGISSFGLRDVEHPSRLSLGRRGGIACGDRLDVGHFFPGGPFGAEPRETGSGREAPLDGRDHMPVLRQPPSLCEEHLVGHLLDLVRSADRADERVQQHGLVERADIPRDSGLDSQPLHADRLCANGGALRGEIPDLRNADAISIHVARRFNDAISGKIGDASIVDHIEVAPINAPRHQRLEQPGCVFTGAGMFVELPWRFGKQPRIFRLKPVPPLLGDAEIAAGLPMDP